jgi:hypothetical protein
MSAPLDRLRRLLAAHGVTVSVVAVAMSLSVGVGCGPEPDVLLPEPTARIRGLVLDPQLVRAAGVKVQLEPVGNPPCRFDTFTRVDGTYELEGICPGLYDVVVSGTIAGVVHRTRLRFLQLSAGQTALVPDLVLRPAAALTGRALLAGATDHSGISVALVGTNRRATTDAAGNYTIADVEEGTYAINFQRTGFIEQTVDRVTVPAGVTTTVTVVPTLRPVDPPATATLRGQVLLETRTDHGGVLVAVDGTERNLITTSGGFWTFAGLPVSTYSVTFRRRSFFDRTLGGLTIVPGTSALVAPTLQLDSHRVLSTRIAAFDLEHAPNGSQILRATSASAPTGELGLTDPTAQVFDQVVTLGALVTPFAGLAWSPDTRDILFVRSFASPANSSAIGTVRNDGTALRNLLPVSTQYLAPAWAPDGTAFAYFLAPSIRTIRVDRSTGSLAATTSTSVVVDTLAGVVAFSGMEWSATGRIMYSFSQTGAAGVRSAGIFTIFSTGGGRLQVVPRTGAGQTISAPESPTFRPDFARIGFSWREPPGAAEPPDGIYVMDLDGTNATRITTVLGINLDWSPDGTRILFTRAATDTVNPSRIHEVLVPQ